MSLIIGIDPGVSGAIVLIETQGFIVEKEDGGVKWRPVIVATGHMPTVKRRKSKKYTRDVDARELFCILRNWVKKDTTSWPLVFLERISARPGQGVVSMFSMGNALGVIQGVLAALDLAPTLVTPVVWKRHYDLLHSDKEASRQKAIELFGAGHFPLKKDHGLAEAALIGWYGANTRVKHLTEEADCG